MDVEVQKAKAEFPATLRRAESLREREKGRAQDHEEEEEDVERKMCSLLSLVLLS